MFKKLLLAVLLTTGVAIVAFTQTVKPEVAKLTGTRKVDLRSTPDAPVYFQKFEVKKIEGDTFTGTFYNSEIKNAHFNRDWGAVYFAFTTEDQGAEFTTLQAKSLATSSKAQLTPLAESFSRFGAPNGKGKIIFAITQI